MDDALQPIIIYKFLVYSPLVHLLEGVLGIGMFVVGLGYLRQAVRDPDILRHSPFWKRMLLLGCVVMFVTYVTITYEVDLTPTQFQSLADVKRIAAEMSSERLTPILDQAKSMMLTVLPIDLLGIVLTAALFAVLSLKDLESLLKHTENEDSAEAGPLDRFGVLGQIKLLFLLTGLWHVLIVGWWLIGSFHACTTLVDWLALWQDLQGQYSYDILYHLSFATAHSSYFFLWKRLETRRWERKHATRLEWWGLATYAALVICVYSTRLSNYVDRLADSALVQVQLPLEYLLLPLAVLVSGVAILTIPELRRLVGRR